MRWSVIGNSVSIAVALAMTSHATNDRMCHASHTGLISQDSLADAGASQDMSALSELSLDFSPMAE